MSMQYFGMTDIGAVRKQNQDFYLFTRSDEAGWLLLLLCDGMGGAQAGDIASELAARVFSEYFSASIGNTYHDMDSVCACLRDALESANKAVYDMSRADYSCRGMGTTLVGIYVWGDLCVLINVGDSRGYLLHGDSLIQVTRDHSYVQNLVDIGAISSEEARSHVNRNVITRAIGTKPEVEADLFTPRFLSGDRLLLCSDGLTDMLEDREILPLLKTGNTKDAAEALVSASLQKRATDNITVVVLER